MALSVSVSEHAAIDTPTPLELRAFALWALKRAGVPCFAVEPELYRILIPRADRDSFEGRSEVLFTFNANRYDATKENDLEFAAPGHRLFRWLFAKAVAAGALEFVTPENQPRNISQIAERLFSAYTLDLGSVHLAGCSLEDRFVLQAVIDDDVYADGVAQHDESNAEVLPSEASLIVGPDGTLLSPETQARLGIVSPSPDDEGETKSWKANGEIANGEEAIRAEAWPNICRLVAFILRREGEGSNCSAPDFESFHGDAATTILSLPGLTKIRLYLVRWASGKLRFSHGAETIDASFADWAADLSGPEILCPRSGRKTFHLGITDAGHLAAAEGIVECELSKRRMLEDELVTCTVTGKRVLPEYVQSCPVTAKQAVPQAFAQCPRCRQEVMTEALLGPRCEGCRRTQAIGPGDARLALVLDEYPALATWRRWRLAETESAFIFNGRRFLRGILIVLDKQSLRVLHLAKSGLRPGWQDVSAEEMPAELTGLPE